MSGDKTLYALAEENNRMLRALSRDLGLPPPPEFPKPQPDSSLESTAKALSEQRAEIARCIWSMLRVEKPQDPSLDAALGQVATRLANPIGDVAALVESKARETARANVADRLCAILNPSGMAINGPEGLDLALAEVSAAVAERDRLAHCARETEHKVRDAALEEAAQQCDRHNRLCGANGLNGAPVREAANDIRALKSKPATDGQHYGNFVAAVGKQRYEAMQSSEPEPVHDFGWALARMREGKKVRRQCWVRGEYWALATGSTLLAREDAFATDWQVVE